MSMRTARLALAGFASLTLTGAVLLISGPASATATCTSSTTVDGPQDVVVVPSTASGDTNCNLVEGDVSQAVLQLQATMNVCYGRSLKEDGVFGGNTYSALKYVQGKVGTPADGQYGPHTRDKMHFMEAESDGVHILCFPY